MLGDAYFSKKYQNKLGWMTELESAIFSGPHPDAYPFWLHPQYTIHDPYSD